MSLGLSLRARSRILTALFVFLSGCLVPQSEVTSAEPSLSKVAIRSTQDGADQFAMTYLPDTRGEIPLLVVLHSWSGGYDQKGQVEPALAECVKRKWALIHPDFRGRNRRPEACASDLAVQDVLDAVDWVKTQREIDDSRIYLIGASGGGHMSLVMAERAPDVWAAVSSWVPITDLATWYTESVERKTKYAGEILSIFGGPPGTSPAIDEQYRKRSSLFWLDRAKGLPIDINAGIDDGHTGSVPVSHSLRAFNVLAKANGVPDVVFDDHTIQQVTAERKVPAALKFEGKEEDREHPVLLRQVAGPARITIFQGGHEADFPTGIRWLATHQKKANLKAN